MTMYILAGGADEKYPEYFAQLSRVVHDKIARPKILSCGFSIEDSLAEARFPDSKKMFEERFGDSASITLASKENFVFQVREADVVYFHGGSTKILLEAMQAYPGIKSEFAGKIIIGSSAGANYLSSYCWSPTMGAVVKGGGLIDAAVINHYRSTGFEGYSFEPEFWDEAIIAVREISGKTEILLLPEGAFTVIEQS